jgi:hypothetical protein
MLEHGSFHHSDFWFIQLQHFRVRVLYAYIAENSVFFLNSCKYHMLTYHLGLFTIKTLWVFYDLYLFIFSSLVLIPDVGSTPGYLFTKDLTTTIKISFLLYTQLNATRPQVRIEVLLYMQV